MDNVFGDKNTLSFEEYLAFNREVSSEMFYSIMSLLHERLPCAPNFFRLKKIYRSKVLLGGQQGINPRKCQSPSRVIASPSMLKVSGFSKAQDPMTPTLPKNRQLVQDLSNQRKNSMSGFSSNNGSSRVVS